MTAPTAPAPLQPERRWAGITANDSDGHQLRHLYESARVANIALVTYNDYVVPVVIAPRAIWNEMIYALHAASEDDVLVCFCGDEDDEDFQMCAKCRIEALAPLLALMETTDG